MPCNIANYKVSCKCSALPLDIVKKELEAKNIQFRPYNNFIVFEKVFTYIIFKSGKSKDNHINITKIKQRHAIEEAISVISGLLNCNIRKLKIDNITATTCTNGVIDLYHISQKEKLNTWGVLKYNSQKFPGLFIKHSLGTIIIFHSGKIVILGCKKEEDIEWLANQAVALILT